MEQIKAYKFRIYPNNYQKEIIEKTFGCCRFVYNKMLSIQIKSYEENKKIFSKYELMKKLPSLKKEYN